MDGNGGPAKRPRYDETSNVAVINNNSNTTIRRPSAVFPTITATSTAITVAGGGISSMTMPASAAMSIGGQSQANYYHTQQQQQQQNQNSFNYNKQNMARECTLMMANKVVSDMNALVQYLESNNPELLQASHLVHVLTLVNNFVAVVQTQQTFPTQPTVQLPAYPFAPFPNQNTYNSVPVPTSSATVVAQPSATVKIEPPKSSAVAIGGASKTISPSSATVSVSQKAPNYKVTHMEEAELLQSKLDDFEFMEILGTGTFGKVRLCRHKVTKKHFCMKILNKARIFRLKQTEHIYNERNVLKQINHPFIVRLFNSFKDKSSLYLLLEFIPGGELFNYIRRSGKLTTEVSRIYSAEIILALEHLHSKKILYRDLKPENILIDETGHVKLTDFGFSKFVPTDRTMSMCGTPEYIAPEIILNIGHGKAVDWWSLGILIFEMLAGYPPFSDEPNKTIFEKIPLERVEFPPGFDPLAQDLIEKLLVVDSPKRLGSSRTGAQDIKDHPWFGGLDWTAVSNKQVSGPVNPGITKDGDTHNFYKYSDVNLNEDLGIDENANLDEIFAEF
eukprot:TRINITY_DN6967_c0_g1_i1.p1 TRINITY_DN6967_c0_g1~~TRINITY_DN6967_c0_g1_i1.p1  ORF type:complete len:561 (+),score=148.04 TRINITY_DN6967_c0_g1_i1:116-1798(+)